MEADPLRECRLLLVDDEPANLDLLEEFLRPEGFAALLRCADARVATALFAVHAPDLVLLDLHMPHRSGFELLAELQERTAPDDFVPILVLTADASADARARALSGGAHDFLTKPLDGLEVRLRVRNLLRTRLLHRQQRAAREAAEAASAAREQVLSFVAHDLRNPLASIAMDAEMLRHLLSEEEQPVQYRTIARIERTAQRMHHLAEDLLEIVRLDHGTFATRREPLAACAVLAEAEAMLRPLARARQVALSFAGPADLPPIHADAERLLQALSNLVGNALESTSPGDEIAVGWRAEEGELLIRVADTGPGIPAEELPHLFDPFWQGGGSGERGRRRGLGLGLLITRAIVEAHGGRIWIESTLGAGTTAYFTLPFQAPPPPAPTRAPFAGEDPGE